MSSNDPNMTVSSETGRRRVIAWPLSFVLLTAAFLLMGNVLTACGGHHRGGHDIEDAKEHAADAVDHMMHRLDGTDAQTEQVQAIVTEAIDELIAAHGPKDGLGDAFSAILTADTIDRDALETMRRQHLDRAEVMSEIAMTRFADVLEVLTPEQRAKLDKKFSKHRGRHGWH